MPVPGLTLLLIPVFLYAALMLRISFGWMKVKSFIFQKSAQSTYFRFSVIVAFRNEIKNLPRLIDSLERLNFPKECFEVILINDHSEDQGLSWLQKSIAGKLNFKLLDLPEEMQGKKAALRFAATTATGKFLVFTDADCSFGADWLYSYNQFFQKRIDVSLAIGLVDYMHDKRFLNKLFRLDFLTLILSGAGMAALGRPVMCNGANIAVKRDDFLSVRPHAALMSSGDDVFLLHALKKQDKTVALLKSPENLVLTAGPETLTEFVHQRIRWGSKAPFYRDRDILLLSVVVLSANGVLLCMIPLAFLTNFFWCLLIGFGIKLIVDSLIFVSGARFFRFNQLLYLIPLISLAYPFYLFLLGFLSIKKPFHWKGRILKI